MTEYRGYVDILQFSIPFTWLENNRQVVKQLEALIKLFRTRPQFGGR
jgi:hypothetical protein